MIQEILAQIMVSEQSLEDRALSKTGVVVK